MPDTIRPYVRVLPTANTARILDELVRSIGLPGGLARTDFHVTEINSGVEVSVRDMKYALRPNLAHKTEIKGVELFNSEHHQNLVLELESDTLLRRHKAFVRVGCTHGFDSYRPHVTLFTDPFRKNILMDEATSLELLTNAKAEIEEALKLSSPSLFWHREWMEPAREN